VGCTRRNENEGKKTPPKRKRGGRRGNLWIMGYNSIGMFISVLK
jgi:hypothetical protein